MPSVDDRVVAMKFDNASFEQKVASTISSLDKLKGSLDFANSKRGMDELNTSAKAFNLDGIAQAIDGIGSHFTAMGAIAFTVLQNIVNRAIDAGINLAKSLSLNQVISGFQEYNTNLNSIQTILANTRSDNTTLQDVNKALDELNHYSDQTIYNFSQMTRNIGTFTAAGVDLKTSTAAIKGIANLAAVSGSSADQASVAMYQLSQALASGTVKLMDWNSVVNAGMGGEVFQKALFETGKSLGTLKKVKLNETFEEWKAAGNSFRGSLEDGWITADVLTNTLQGFTGDLTEAQIKALGYTDEQTKNIMEMGKVAQDAATKVKTLPQLLDTTKEAVGSGWSETFRIIFGTFEEARATFTNFSNAINEVISRSAEQRNALLQNWKDLGGREVLIQGITQAFKALSGILRPIKAAFRDVFPPVTVVTLNKLTHAFRDLMERLTPSPAVAVLITRTFRGIFSVFQIGIEIVKGVAHFFGKLIDTFNKSNDPNKGILGFTARLGDKLYALKKALVDAGGIANFFENLGTNVANFIDSISLDGIVEKFKEVVQNVKDAIVGIFTGNLNASDVIHTPEVLDSLFQRLGDRFGWLGDVAKGLGKAWDGLVASVEPIKNALGNIVDFIKDKFSKVPQAISDAFSDIDYNQTLDTVNTGLFGGLVLLIHNFMNNGFKNFGNGAFKNISQAFSQLTGVLSAMQTNLKAEALMKIAGAVGLLTASVVVLSLIDSATLTKSMTAIGIAFGELAGTMATLDKLISGPTAAGKLALVATGMIAMAGAMLLLSAAAKMFSSLSWEEIAKGLVSVSLLLVGVSLAAKPLSENSGGMIKAGLGIIGIATAMNILALATKSFAEMNWEGMAQGLTGVAVGLLAIMNAVNLMPEKGMVAKGLGLIAIATALNILALATKSFAELDWAQMGKGMAGIAAALLVLTVALDAMPNGALMALQGVGLALVGAGLVAISKAMQTISTLSWEEIAKGLVGIAGALNILAGVSLIMEESLPGAAAIAVMAFSLSKIADAVKKFAGISWKELLKGLGALAATLGVLAAAALLMEPAIVPMLGLAAALVLLGAGMALFGVGANLVATAFGIIATAGTAGVATLMSALDGLIERLPAIIAALADGFIELAKTVVAALPTLIAGLGEALGALFQLIIDNLPKLGELLVEMIHTALKAVRDTFPDLVATGLEMLLALLRGIRDNIAEITQTVVDIITNFLDALAERVPQIIDSVVNLIWAILRGVVEKLTDIHLLLVEKGIDLLQGLWNGIDDKAKDVLNWFKELPGKLLSWAGNLTETLWDKGIEIASGIYNGIIEKVKDIIKWFFDLPNKVLGWVGDLKDTLLGVGKDVINGLWRGMKGVWEDVKGWLSNLNPAHWFNDINPYKHHAEKNLIPVGQSVMLGLQDGMQTGWEDITGWLRTLDPSDNISLSLSSIAEQVGNLEDMNPTITPVLDLTSVKAQAASLKDILAVPDVQSSLALAQANDISANTLAKQTEVVVPEKPTTLTEIKFEQNNYSPEALSTSDIYRRTRNQIAMAKEALVVP